MAYGTIYRITGGSLYAATSNLNMVTEGFTQLVRAFIEASQNVIFFLHKKAPISLQKNLKTSGAYTDSTDLNFKPLQTNYSSRDTVSLKYC